MYFLHFKYFVADKSIWPFWSNAFRLHLKSGKTPKWKRLKIQFIIYGFLCLDSHKNYLSLVKNICSYYGYYMSSLVCGIIYSKCVPFFKSIKISLAFLENKWCLIYELIRPLCFFMQRSSIVIIALKNQNTLAGIISKVLTHIFLHILKDAWGRKTMCPLPNPKVHLENWKLGFVAL